MKSRIAFLSLAAVLLVVCGCVSDKVIGLDAKNPSVTVKTSGVYFGDQRVNPADVPVILDDAGVPKSDTIHILLDSEVHNLGEARSTMGFLAKAGYSRSMLVTRRHAESEKIDQAEKMRRMRAQMEKQSKQQINRKVRYK